MPSGFRVDSDQWLKEYTEAKQIAQDIVQLIQERNSQHLNTPEGSRRTAVARRKIGTLGTMIEKLLKSLDSSEGPDMSELEINRRRDLLYELRNRREQMQHSIKRDNGQQNRDALLSGASASRGPAMETEQTAELDSQGLLQMQKHAMNQQDQALEKMEKTVTSTKHIALAIGEEVDLQTRLLDDLDEDVDVTNHRMRAATKRVKNMIKDTSHWKGGCMIFVLIVTLVMVTIIGFKLLKLFGG
eukprot:gene20265-27019_t